jgi:hypothetical protein
MIEATVHGILNDIQASALSPAATEQAIQRIQRPGMMRGARI